MKSIINKIKFQLKLIKERQSSTDKSQSIALILGNSPSINRICNKKLLNLCMQNNVDLFVCNGFFAKPIIDLKLFKEINYFAADNLIGDYFVNVSSKRAHEKFVESLIGFGSYTDENVKTFIEPSLKCDALSLEYALKNDNINVFLSETIQRHVTSHVVNSLPTHGVYLFPRFLRRAFYRLPLNYRLFPLVGPSIVKLMINYAVYNNYNKVLVAGDHDSDLTKLKGNRNKWGRSYNYFFSKSDNQVEYKRPYANYLRNFLLEQYDETFLPKCFDRVQYISNNHYKSSFPNFSTHEIMED